MRNSWSRSLTGAWDSRRHNSTRSSAPSFPPNPKAPAWGSRAVGPSSSRMAAACGRAPTQERAPRFVLRCPRTDSVLTFGWLNTLARLLRFRISFELRFRVRGSILVSRSASRAAKKRVLVFPSFRRVMVVRREEILVRREDSNSHGFPCRSLKTMCLPVPPLPQFKTDLSVGRDNLFHAPHAQSCSEFVCLPGCLRNRICTGRQHSIGTELSSRESGIPGGITEQVGRDIRLAQGG